jgi:hypothetical protein
MNGLDTPHDRWDAETAKPGAGNTGLAAIPGDGVDITADVRRHEAVNSFKDCRSAPKRQGRSWPVRVRPQKWRA